MSAAHQIIESQSSQTKNKMGWQWEHPKVSAILQTDYAELGLELIQDFLEFFKFQYTLAVFTKEANRKGKINREGLSQRLGLPTNDKKPCLVKILTGAGFKISSSKPKEQHKSKLPALNQPLKAQTKVQPIPPKKSQKQLREQQQEEEQRRKQQERQAARVQKQQKRIAEKKKRQQEQPKTAAQFLKDVIKPAKKDQKAQRGFSAPPKKQLTIADEVGSNQIRGKSLTSKLSSTFKSSLNNFSDPYAFNMNQNPFNTYDRKRKNEEEFQESVNQEIQQLQNSKLSRGNNPMFTSSESMQGSQSISQSQGHDQLADSDQIEMFDFWEQAKKRKK